ncbi:MAG: hexapeptide transferase, partial [Rhodothermales bacterium]|nr:hexapeptide transferase [Rhodothermales bacterium]
REELGWSRLRQWAYIVRDSLWFNISILEYYQFRFFELSEEQKGEWAGTGTMYEFQRIANPPATRGLLHDKRDFYKAYRKFFRHELHSLADLKGAPQIIGELLAKHHKLVFKDATGNCGASISIRRADEMTATQLIEYMERDGFDLVETFIDQHSALHALSPSAVNTVRVFTQFTKEGGYEVLGCRLRISIDSPVDNLAAGNVAAPIDANSGIVNGPGVFSDITREPIDMHPVTGVSIVGFQVPFWKETLELVREASLLHPENRSIGWDVVLTEAGPGLIEGNHDWCKLVWQLPVRRGLKKRLDFGE